MIASKVPYGKWEMPLKYKVFDNLSLSAGFLHEGTPVPDSTFEPSVPAGDKNYIGLGLSWGIMFC